MTKMTKMTKTDTVIGVIICGYRQGGTTLLSSILASSPDLCTKFETGLLSLHKPSNLLLQSGYLRLLFQKLQLNNRPLKGQLPTQAIANIQRSWKLNDEQLIELSQSKNFLKMYEYLLAHANLKLPLIDKYPDYIYAIDNIFKHYSGKVIFTSRDPRALYWSRQKRLLKQRGLIDQVSDYNLCHSKYWEQENKLELEIFCREYKSIFHQAQTAKKRYPKNFSIIRNEDLLTNFDDQKSQLFRGLNLQLNTSIKEKERIGVSIDKLRPGIDQTVITEYRQYLSPNTQDTLLEKLKCCKEFIYQQA